MLEILKKYELSKSEQGNIHAGGIEILCVRWTTYPNGQIARSSSFVAEQPDTAENWESAWQAVGWNTECRMTISGSNPQLTQHG